MTVSTTTSKISYTGNAVTTVFSFPYPFIAAGDMNVYVDGVLKTLTTDYTVSGSAPYPAGANITFLSAPANLASIVISRIRPYTQTLDIVENDPLPAEPLEQELDSQVMMIQQLLEQLNRAVVIPITDTTGTTVTIPNAATRANQALLFDSVGNVTVGAIAGAPVSVAMQPVVAASTLALARTALGATTVGNALFTTAGAAAARSTLGAAASGANSDITSMTALSSINGGQLAGFRNKIINGRMELAQRGTSFTNATASFTYALDRYRFFGQAGGAGSGTVSQVAHTVGQTDVPYEPQFYLRWNQTVAPAVGTRCVLSQPIESIRTLAGRQVTISFYARVASGTFNLNTRFVQNFGGGGSAAVNSAEQVNALTATFQKFTHTLTLASISGLTVGTSDYLDLQFLPATGVTHDVHISDLEVEIGGNASPIEQRPLGVEFALAQRFFEKSFLYGTAPAQNAGTTGDFVFVAVRAGVTGEIGYVPLQVRKRTPPSITLFNTSAANAQVRDVSAGADCSASAVIRIGENGFVISCAGNGATAIGNLLEVHWTADSEF